MTEDSEVTPPSPVVAARRPMLKAMGGVAAIAVVGGSARLLNAMSTPRTEPGGLVLETHESAGMASLELPVDDDALTTVGTQRWRSAQLDTTTYTMAAFIWAVDSKDSPAFRLRSRRDDDWGPWTTVPPMHGGQDTGTEGRSKHAGTELLWVGRSSGVQYEVSGARPDRLRLVLLYPRPRLSDSSLDARSSGSILTKSAPAALEPLLLSRQDWGADETWRNGGPAFNHLMQQVHVHHTANGNDYASDEVPTLIRGIYRYHTHYLGWSDIAYNFLVDRFGVIWEGRAGGSELLVRGAHTRGFNSSSTGVAVIGNFDEVRPTSAILRSVAQIAAWKVHESGGWPRGKVRVRSEGSDLYKPDELVTLRVIDGHRDTNETACPGQYLYEALPVIRRRAGKLVRAAEAAAQPVQSLSPPTITGSASVGSELVLQPGAYDPPDATLTIVWLRSGAEILGATQATYVAAPEDFGTQLSARVIASYDGRAPASQLSAATGPVTAVPSAKVRAAGGRGRARVKVRVQAPDGVPVTPVGHVEVSLGGRKRSVRLVDGRASAGFKGLRPGRRRVSVRYLGADGLTPIETGDIVRIG